MTERVRAGIEQKGMGEEALLFPSECSKKEKRGREGEKETRQAFVLWYYLFKHQALFALDGLSFFSLVFRMRSLSIL